MIDRLRSASEQLRSAWDNYLQVCSEIEDYSYLRRSLRNLPVELSQQFESELTFLPAYELNSRQTRAIIGRARNFAYTLTPINSLPLEILSRIFRFVPPRVCRFHRLVNRNSQHFPRALDYLAHVCSFWRQAAISPHSLWTHIDLSTRAFFWKGPLARAEVYVTRAGRLPVEVHIADTPLSYSGSRYDMLYNFLARISSRMVALDLVTSGDFPAFHWRVPALTALLRGTHTILTNLIVRFEPNESGSPQYSTPPYLGMEESSSDWGVQNTHTNVTSEHNEKAFVPLEVLYLRGIFPEWPNHTYHSLVDPRLTSVEGRILRVKESRLLKLLKSSPVLEVLHLGLTLTDLSLENRHINPVHFQDLQVVKIFTDSDNYWATKLEQLGSTMQVGSILRLLAPGSQPLRLSIHSEPEHRPFSAQEIERLFERAKITKFYYHWGLPPIATLLRYASQLEVVELDGCEYSCKYDPNPFQLNASLSFARLRRVYIRDSLQVQDLHTLVGICPDGIVLYNDSLVLRNEEDCWTAQ